MRVYLDCEFNGFGGELLSLGMVREDGHEFYEVVSLSGHTIIDPWVADNVVPHLGQPGIQMGALRTKLVSFLRVSDPVTIVVDWPSDAMYLCQILLGADHTQTVNIPMSIEIVDIDGDLGSALPHNALSDARAIMTWAESNPPRR